MAWILSRLSFLLNWIAAWCLVGMLVLTCADIVLRLFRHPILGTYEVVGLLGAIAAAFALAQTTIKGGHVAVQILVRKLPRVLQKAIFLVTQIMGMVLFALLSWESVRYGADLKKAGEVSMTLEIPFYPVLYGIAACAALTCLVLGLDLLRVATGRAEPWPEWES